MSEEEQFATMCQELSALADILAMEGKIAFGRTAAGGVLAIRSLWTRLKKLQSPVVELVAVKDEPAA